MIYTVTLNPSLDYNIKLNDFEEGKVNIIKSEYKTAGGKGINVSQVLRNLGHNSIALGFIGGFTGEYIEKKLIEKNIKCDFIKINQDTRINVKIKNGESETEINGKKVDITNEQLRELFCKIDDIKKGDILILSGSIPSSLSENIYKEISKKIADGVKIVVDTTGEALIKVLEQNPFLVKPNNHELEELFNVKLEKIEDIIKYGKKLQIMGAQNVIVSLAGDGAILITENKIYLSNVPKGIVKNSVGAGDSLVGGFIAASENGKEILECFKMGVASGSASAFSDELCKKKEVEKLMKEIKIKKVLNLDDKLHI
ncbi:MAG: 1-phosphofructokinase [Fusobacteriia bacterium 4572_132]|nr:MAG: 1-phosphofructokinase [Fusobacteriia bacterium 4572_132]